MKRNLISLTAISICLVACGKESDFKKAINDKISQTPVCLNVYKDSISGSGLNEDTLKKLKDKTKDSYIIEQRYDKDGKYASYSTERDKQKFVELDSLVGAGLLAKTTESLITYSYWGDKKPDGGFIKYTIYNLTDAGKATTAKVEVSAMSKAWSGDDGQRVFCYAHPEVEAIENYTEADSQGYQTAQVKYSYKYVDIADWINKSGVKEAFPEIDATLNKADKTGRGTLVKTKNGWSTDL